LHSGADNGLHAGAAASRPEIEAVGASDAEARAQREAEDAVSSAAARARDGVVGDAQRLVSALHSAQEAVSRAEERAKVAEEEAGSLRIAHERDAAEIQSERDRAAKVNALLQAPRSYVAYCLNRN